MAFDSHPFTGAWVNYQWPTARSFSIKCGASLFPIIQPTIFNWPCVGLSQLTKASGHSHYIWKIVFYSTLSCAVWSSVEIKWKMLCK